MKLFRKKTSAPATGSYDSAKAYNEHLDARLAHFGGNRELAFADAIGSVSLETFREQGDGHVAVLRAHGLADGMAVFDLGCGCGRTAQALQRSGWQGRYAGSDIIARFVEELNAKCTGYNAVVHNHASIPMPDASLDMVFHWSVFTHISPEECYLYLEDIFRTLKPGGRLVFSFLEHEDSAHDVVFSNRLKRLRNDAGLTLLDTYLHRDWIRKWAGQIGFVDCGFTDGSDDTRHPVFWQALAHMTKPAG